MYAGLQEFITALDQAGELKRIGTQVSPILEITEIVDRVSKSQAASISEHANEFDPLHADLGGHALLFENVAGSKFPLAINTLGSYKRMEMALGVTDGGFQAMADTISALVKPEPPSGLMAKMKKGLELAKIASFAPKYVRNGACQQVVKTGDDINLFDLPILKCWPHDGDPRKVGYPVDTPAGGGDGRFITLAGMYTIHPDDADKPAGEPRPSRNIGMYRAQLIDKNHTAMHWHMHHDGARHWRAWKKIGKPMPLAIVLGGESVLPYAATAPLPPGISELLFAGFLAGKGIDLVQCKTIDMHVPANAEIVLEGHVSTEAGFVGYDPRTDGEVGPGAVFEGPFGDHTGFYSLPDRYPLFEVTAMTHRKNAVYPTTVVGLPPQEDYYMGKATERLFLPLLKTLVPDIIDYDLPMFGTFHNCAFIKIQKEYPLQARRVMHAIWGAGQMAWTKMIVVVDADVNVHDYEEVMFHVCANSDPGRDLEIVNGPLDILDHAAPRLGAGHKLGIDATRKIKGEEVNGHPVRDWPPILEMSDDVVSQVTTRWKEYGL
ncbi:MAG: menaquinone biosynthesis decarboxylase [Phycisphaeraceae bacterium]|nr:menaquinone biosynthesis decarboxylase [Phycisphaeraceae bacterium]